MKIKDILEGLSKKDDMGTWIKDFYDSDAPQFKGKPKAKRREMAIAAKLSANENASAEEENKFHRDLDNLVHKTFGQSTDEKEQEQINEVWWKTLPTLTKAAKSALQQALSTPGTKQDKIRALRKTAYELENRKELTDRELAAVQIAINALQKRHGRNKYLAKNKLLRAPNDLEGVYETPNQLRGTDKLGKSPPSFDGEQKNVTKGKLVGETTTAAGIAPVSGTIGKINRRDRTFQNALDSNEPLLSEKVPKATKKKR